MVDVMKHASQFASFGILLVLVMSGIAGEARADRFLLQVGDMRPVYCGDANEYIGSLEPQSGMVPSTPGMLVTLPPPPAAPAPGVAVTPEAANQCNRAATEPTPRLQGMPAEMSEVIQPPSGPPDAAFLAQLNAVYSITVPAEIQQAYEWYLKEPAGLPIASRVGNGVVRFIMAVDRSPTGDTAARPDLLKPEATSGTVRSSNGVSIRGAPWQPGAGGAIAQGGAVTVIPPADGPWYQIQSAQGNGWVCGLWLDLN